MEVEGTIVGRERTVEEVAAKAAADGRVAGHVREVGVVQGIVGTSAGGLIRETGTVAGTKAEDGGIGIVGE